MIKNNKFEFTVLAFLLVFSLISFGFYLIYKTYSSKLTYTLFLNPYTVLECKKWNCDNMSSDLLKYNNKPYNIFMNGKSVGLNDVYYNSKDKNFYVFDSNNNNIYEEGSFLAYNGKASIKQINFKNSVIDLEDYEFLKKEIKDSFSLENVDKVSLDFDNDNELETLYVINREADLEKISVLLYRDKNKIKVLNKEKNEDPYEVGTGYISNVLDIFEDNKLEFVYSIEYFDNIGSCNILYRLKGSNFVKVNDCEIIN